MMLEKIKHIFHLDRDKSLNSCTNQTSEPVNSKARLVS